MTWGPWSPGLAEGERVARLRALRVAVHLLAGRAVPAVALLRDAETNPDAMDPARRAVEALPTAVMRRVVASYGAACR